MSQPDAKESKHAASSFLANAQFAVVAEGLYDRKIEFIAAGNVYYTRREELTWLLNAAEKAGICLDHSTINKSSNPRIVRIYSAKRARLSKHPNFSWKLKYSGPASNRLSND